MLRQAYTHKTLLGCPRLMADINSKSESDGAAGDDNKDDVVNFHCDFSLSALTRKHSRFHLGIEDEGLSATLVFEQ